MFFKRKKKMKLELFYKYKGEFKPVIAGNLKPRFEKHIGKVLVFSPSWIVEKGEYEGQWACQIFGEIDKFGDLIEMDISGRWLPQEDFCNIEKTNINFKKEPCDMNFIPYDK